jgi:phosphoglycolate phosphatase
MTPACNICGGTEFREFRGRKNEQCTNCNSKARHRIGLHVYETHLFPLMAQRPTGRVLHMAPEAALHGPLQRELGARYITSDPRPEKYPHAKCQPLYFPQDFQKFANGHFDAILHNHVLEHIPGHYGDHLLEFARLLSAGGRMIFSFPGPYKGMQTREGGEHLATDAERLEQFRQIDHFKMIGDDFHDTLQNLPNGKVIPDGVSNQLRATLGVRPNKAPFFIWQRN